jgi:hypothetical protein
MNGLIGTRVLLLDDEPKEALPVIKAFSKVGVPIAYFDGNQDSFPLEAEKLRGVRLAILDIDLGFGGNSKNLASTLAGTFSRIVSQDNGPYGILIWTNHKEHVDEVSAAIFNHQATPKPIFVVSLSKAGFLNGIGKNSEQRATTAAIRDALRDALKKGSAPFESLQQWESLGFAASTNVINSISDLAGVNATTLNDWQKAWKEEMLRLLLVIARAGYGKHLSEKNVLRSLFLTLNPLQLDRMDSLSESNTSVVSHHAKGIFSAQGAALLARRAGVNSMLHLSTDNLKQFSPGNLYLFEPGKPHPSFMPTIGELLKGWTPGSGDKLNENLIAISKAAHLCAVEISPVCDHAQDKIGLSRLIAGVILPWDTSVKMKSGQFIKTVGPLRVKDVLPSGEYGLHLNSRYVTSSALARVRRLKPTFRVKPELLADLQTWSSYQGSRQGIRILE